MNYRDILIVIAFVLTLIAFGCVMEAIVSLLRAATELFHARAWYWRESAINEELQQVKTKRELEEDVKDNVWKDKEE